MNIKEKQVLLCSKYNSINRLLAIYGIEWQDREDLLQEIFANAYRSLHQLRDVKKMDAWLWAITRNEMNRYWKDIRALREMEISLDDRGGGNLDSKMSDAEYRGLLSDIEFLCEKDELAQALKLLPRKTLIILRLYFYEGYKFREIAQITGESESAIKSRQQRGLKQLKEIVLESRQEEADSDFA